MQYSWRGNVRELSHLIERLVVTVSDFIIKPFHLPNTLFEISNQANSSGADSFDEIVDEFKKNLIVDAYKKLKSSRRVAKELKISQSKASRLIKQYCDVDDNMED